MRTIVLAGLGCLLAAGCQSYVAPACVDGKCPAGRHCVGGVCQPGECEYDWECDDQDPCTADTCVDHVCVNKHLFGELLCTDNSQCRPSAGCSVWACNSCGLCEYSPAPDGTPCDDGNSCTMNDACSSGKCKGVPLDADGDRYSARACGGTDCDDFDPLVHPGAAEGPPGDPTCSDHKDNDCDGLTDGDDPGCRPCKGDADCDDHDVCNGLESCAGGQCQPGPPLDCNDGNLCTDDACDPAGGCLHTAISCDDGNLCSDDHCDPAAGCIHSYNALPCDDGDACTFNDHCTEGICTGTLLTCNDDNVCTDDSCDPVEGCVYTNNTSPCNDGKACTINDICSGGVCAGTVIDADGDGYLAIECGGMDCDDNDPTVHPGGMEGPPGDPTCFDGKDNDCNGLVDAAGLSCRTPELVESVVTNGLVKTVVESSGVLYFWGQFTQVCPRTGSFC